MLLDDTGVNILTALKRCMNARPFLRRLHDRPQTGLGILFDAAYYGRAYRGPLPPLAHFIAVGAFEGANPHPLFDPAFYLRKYPDVAASGVNPLFHYLLHGAAEGRKPHPLFQPDYYVAQRPEAAGAPLLHFLAAGEAQRGNPHPLFDCRCYLRGRLGAHPHASLNPLVDFVMRGPSAVVEGCQYGQGAA